MNYIFYTPDGEITKLLSCNESDLPFNVKPGDLHIPGTASFNDYVDTATLAVYPKPPQPSANHKFNYTTKQWQLDAELVTESVLAKRQQLLQASDWAALPDVPMTTEQRAAWATYRQDLRDITSQSGYPLEVYWPVAPG